MKRYVNGQEADLIESSDIQITPLHDRLMVRTPTRTHSAVAVRVGDTVHVSYKGHIYLVEKATAHRHGGGVSSGEMRAPMPGLIVDVLVSEGASVQKGDKILILEAMKTQQTFTAPFDGVVEKLMAQKGMQVQDGQVLAVVAENESVTK